MSSNQCSGANGANDGIELSHVLPEAQTFGSSVFRFQSACGKWDECQPGDLFVAINDLDGDGHDFITEAIERGATGIVSERLLPVSVPQFIVGDSRIAYGKVCHALAGRPSQRLSTIGITGSAGKTVTAHLIHHILESAGKTAGLSSSIHSRFGDLTTDEPSQGSSPHFAHQLSKMVFSKCSHAVIETSSVDLARRALAGIQLDSAVITNSHPCNLGFHNSSHNYRNAITNILDSIKPTGFAVINADDKHCSKWIDSIQIPTLTFGIHKAAEISAKLLERNASFQTFLLTAGGETSVVRTSMIGKQHIYNCLAAASIGLTFGIELDVISRALESVKVPGRLERIDCGQDFGVWIDSSRAPNQLIGAISALGQICDGKLWCICSTDPEQTQDERKQLGTILERKTDNPIVTQSFSSKHIDYEPCHQILDGFENPAAAHVMPDRIEAIRWAISNARPGDVVLITGAGEKPIAYVENDWTITDKDVCSACLSSPANRKPQFNSDIFRIDDYR